MRNLTIAIMALGWIVGASGAHAVEATAKSADMFGTTWIVSPDKHDTNVFKIEFNKPKTCIITVLSGGSPQGTVSCVWTESLGQVTSFGLTGGSFSLVGICPVAAGPCTANGIAFGNPIEGFSFILTK